MSTSNELTLPSIEIAVSCTFFQRRLTWMLSSVLQQEGNVPPLIFNVAFPINNGNPTTESVCDYFEGRGLTMRRVPYEGMERIQYRGLVRNDQLKVCTAEWILFADTDMVYHPRFFEDLAAQLQNKEIAQEERMLSTSRISLDKTYCKNFFNNLDSNCYPCEIEGVASIVEGWPIYKIGKNVGAGYFQLVRRSVIEEKYGGIYVNEKKCQDWSWNSRGQKARSDRQFRHMVGGKLKIKTLPQWHLNHERDNEVGHHLTIQR